MLRKTVHYSGRVQGVGFRFTVQRIAAGFEVTGYVKNLPDGRVEVVIEGEPKTLDAMLEDIADVMGSNIRDIKVDNGPATGQFRRFDIAY